jgi:hypothetical protein
MYALTVSEQFTHISAQISTFVLPAVFNRTYNCSMGLVPKSQNIGNTVIQQIMRVEGCIVDPSETVVLITRTLPETILSNRTHL